MTPQSHDIQMIMPPHLGHGRPLPAYPPMAAARAARLAELIEIARSRRTMLRAGLSVALPALAGEIGAYAGRLAAPFRQAPAAAAPWPQFQAPLTYAAIGASDTVGEGVSAPKRDGWVPQFAGYLPQPARLINLGVGGITLHEAIELALPRALEAQPDLITIWLVANDVLGGVPLDHYRAGLNYLLGELRQKTQAVIAIGNAPYPPRHLDPWGIPDVVRRTVAVTWNRTIAAAARAHDAVLVDVYSRWNLAGHPEFIGPDGLHPTVAGYRALADTFAATLRERGLLQRPA